MPHNLNEERRARNLKKFQDIQNFINNQQTLQEAATSPLSRVRYSQRPLLPRDVSSVRRVRMGTLTENSTTFSYGRDMFLDRAVEHLDPDLRPVAPQPNCPQSMKIYNDHRWLAARFVDVEQEIVDLQGYKAQLEERLAADTSNLPPDHGADNPDDSIPPEDVQKLVQLRSEKDALLQFQDKLSTQLQLIKRARQKSKDPSTSSSSMLLSSPPPVSSPLDSSNNHAFSCGKSKPTGGGGGSGPDDSWVFLNDHKK